MYYYFTDKFMFKMRNCINIKANNTPFKYLLEYSKSNSENTIGNNDVICCRTKSDIKLLQSDIKYYRNKNDWYSISNLSDIANIDSDIPENIKLTNIKVYIPTYSVSTYLRNIKYALTLNTWINGVKIDLGSYIFNPIDVYAIQSGCIKDGNNEFYEYIEFDIIDPFYLIYSDEWDNFRKNVCKEEIGTNNSISTINASLYIVEEYNDSYIVKEGLTGGYTNFLISDDTSDNLELKLSISQDPLGFNFDIFMNEVYNDLHEYLYETYNLESFNIHLELVIKDKENIIVDPSMLIPFSISNSEYGKVTQQLLWKNLKNTNLIKSFFNDWNNFSEGWNLVGSLVVTTFVDNEDIEVLSLVSNEIPINQEIFSIFTAGGSKKIIDLSDMNITTYNVVNKIENNITTIERPNESKSNIIQPVFFRVKDTEILTLHPAVTENISINLDNYKSKVDRFTLKIGDNYFDQIGANSYGIIFKVTAHTLPKTASTGIYYILDDNKEVITTGKYSTVI